MSWLEQGKPDEADLRLRRAVELAPEDAEIRYNFGVVLHAQGRLDEAETAYRAAIERMPGHGQARINLALLLIQRGEAPEARLHLEAAMHGFMAQKAKALLEQLDRAPPPPPP
jgi:Flp pilus assembly protein TadD